MEIIGNSLVFGIPEKPIELIDPPKGRIRIRLRPDDWARAYVYDGKQILQYLIVSDGDGCRLDFQHGKNIIYRP